MVTLKVKVIKGLKIDGPIILPVREDLPYLAQPISEEEKRKAQNLARNWEVEVLEESAPISFVGTGVNLNDAVDNALERGANLLGLSVAEVKNRSTITGSIEIGRYPGTATATFLTPIDYLKKAKLYELIKEHYNL